MFKDTDMLFLLSLEFISIQSIQTMILNRFIKPRNDSYLSPNCESFRIPTHLKLIGPLGHRLPNP